MPLSVARNKRKGGPQSPDANNSGQTKKEKQIANIPNSRVTTNRGFGIDGGVAAKFDSAVSDEDDEPPRVPKRRKLNKIKEAPALDTDLDLDDDDRPLNYVRKTKQGGTEQHGDTHVSNPVIIPHVLNLSTPPVALQADSTSLETGASHPIDSSQTVGTSLDQPELRPYAPPGFIHNGQALVPVDNKSTSNVYELDLDDQTLVPEDRKLPAGHYAATEFAQEYDVLNRHVEFFAVLSKLPVHQHSTVFPTKPSDQTGPPTIQDHYHPPPSRGDTRSKLNVFYDNSTKLWTVTPNSCTHIPETKTNVKSVSPAGRVSKKRQISQKHGKAAPDKTTGSVRPLVGRVRELRERIFIY